MLKLLAALSLVVFVAMIAFLVYHASTRGATTSWILAGVWTVALLLVLRAVVVGAQKG